MNRPFWSFPLSPVSACAALEPLLPLYADGLASPPEIRLVEAHLPNCEGCRAELSWIQATHIALASRPVAVPPPDLSSRIALAIAASAAPVTLRPARAFSLRPAYAAAASLAALGIALSYPLWHTPSEVIVNHPVPPKSIASVPAVQTRALPKAGKRPLVAFNPIKPNAVKHIPIARETAPVAVTPPAHTASNLLPTKLPAMPQRVNAPVHHMPSVPLKQIASRDIAPVKAHVLVHLHPEKIITPKLAETPKIANVFKEPVHVPVDIKPPTITVPPPPDQMASNDPLSGLKTQLKEKNAQMRNVSYAATQYTKHLSYTGATNLMRSLDDGSRVATIGDIHSP